MLGILTYKDIPDLTPDDQMFCQHLSDRGVPYKIIDWNAGPLQEPLTHLLIRSPWDYFLKPAAFLRYLEDCQAKNIEIINNLDIIRWNHSKHYMAELYKASLPTVESLFFTPKVNPLEIQDKVKEKWAEVVLKPAISGSAHLTFQVSADSPEFIARSRDILGHGDLMIQPYIESIQKDGEISLIYFNNGEFSHACVKKPKNQDFRVQVEHGGSTVLYEVPPFLKKLCETIFKTIEKDWFYARVDLVDCAKEAKIGELEMLEPALYFTQHPPAAKRFADLLIEKFNLL